MLARVHFAPIRVLNNFKVSLEFSIEFGRPKEGREWERGGDASADCTNLCKFALH